MFRMIHLQHCLLLLVCCCLAIIAGCEGRDKTSDDLTVVSEPKVSDVPLRIWIVARDVNADRIRRQWIADSNQPIEIESVDLQTLLSDQVAECDVLILPARYLGQAITSKQIVRLPMAAFAGTQDSSSDAEQEPRLPAAVRAQVVYGSDEYAVPLGTSFPALIASDAFPSPEGPLNWEQLVETLDLDGGNTSSEVEADLDAVVDRFLMILGTLTEQNPNYGLLFEMQSMRPRLTQPEFIQTAQLLQQLSRQSGGLLSVLGSHDEAWQWVTENERAVVAIAVPNQLSQASREKKSGQLLQIQTVSKIPAWNSGGAMIAALASSCRQSDQAIQFLQWLQKDQTRNALQGVMLGVDAKSAPAGADQLSWRVQQQQLRFLKSESVPLEPSLPMANEFRTALGQALVEFMSGELSADEALMKAHRDWEAITREADLNLRNEYEKSLGLTL